MVDHYKATSQIILQNYVMGDLDELCLKKIAFINFDEESILTEIPYVLDKTKVVIELLESVTISDKLIKAIANLHNCGYKIALDDYDFNEKWSCLFPYISIIKVDIEAIPIEKVSLLTKSDLIKNSPIKILVERVETEKQFRELVEVGVDLFQGYFFHRPELVAGLCVQPIKLSYLELLEESSRPVINFDKVSNIISHDLSLTNSILKLVNLASERNRVEITSIKQAVVFLGELKVKQFITVVLLSKIASDSTNELLVESLIRAHFMESISQFKGFKCISELAFITGMLSNLGPMLRQQNIDVIKELPINTVVKDAIIHEKGMLCDLLCIAKSFESEEEHRKFAKLIDEYELPEELVLEKYHSALEWCLNYCP